MFGSQIGSFHSDLLDASPETNESKRHLVTEIKNRAKNVLATKNYPDAVELYTKAIEVIPEDDANEKSILFSNRSMCYTSMGKFTEAESDSEKSIGLNSLYTKAYFRKTAALVGLRKYKDAREAVLIGLKQIPNDKDLLAQLAKIDNELKNGNQSNESAPLSSSSASPLPSKQASTSKKDTTVEPDEEHHKDTEIVRGYKKLADGRVTTFFNNTLDETTKALIGDIAPRKINSSNDLVSNVEVGSSWNSAGTFESRDLTSWAKDYLTDNLNDDHVGGNIVLNGENYILKILEVKELTGDCEIIVIRGKRKHVCDFTFTLLWQLTREVCAGESVANTLEKVDGTLLIQDFSADGDFEPIFSMSTKVDSSHSVTIKMAKEEIQKRVQQSMQLFIQELKSKV